MIQDIPPPPPEARVIRLAREATGMTAQAAAEAAKALDPTGKGVSPVYWRDVERGAGGRRGQRVSVRASARVLALMARAVGVRQDQLAEARRADAAEILREALRREEPAPAPSPLPAPVSLSEVREARRLNAVVDAALSEPAGRALAQARSYPPGTPGSVIFPGDPKAAQIWDLHPLSETERAEFIARHWLRQDAQRAARLA